MYSHASHDAGSQLYGPVEMDNKNGHVLEMPEEMILHIIESYGSAAALAKQYGYGMVTIHGGHGWLLPQFWSRQINTRKDKWGGSFENRMRLPLAVVDSIRKAVGKNFPIEFRMSGSETNPDGYDIDEGIEFARALDGKVDMLHISAASFDNKRASIRMFPCMFYERGCNAFLAEEIKKHVGVPVVTVGGFADPAQMEQLIAEGRVDAIALGRQLLADFMMPEKARTGREDDIMFCTRCNECMSLNFVPYVKYPLGAAHCAVNPIMSLPDRTYNRIIRKGHQTVLVVGAGPAGMEAALGAAECGHSVVLAEKTGSFGGMLKTACIPNSEGCQALRRVRPAASRNTTTSGRVNTTVHPNISAPWRPTPSHRHRRQTRRPRYPRRGQPQGVLSTEIHEKGLGRKVVSSAAAWSLRGGPPRRQVRGPDSPS
jgi:hypothetical protein